MRFNWNDVDAEDRVAMILELAKRIILLNLLFNSILLVITLVHQLQLLLIYFHNVILVVLVGLRVRRGLFPNRMLLIVIVPFIHRLIFLVLIWVRVLHVFRICQDKSLIF